MDFLYMKEFVPLFITAAGLTARIALFGIIASLLLGLIISLIRYLKIPVLKGILGTYIELSRNTPLVIQLFFLYDRSCRVPHPQPLSWVGVNAVTAV